jgi:hypothetical protein
MTMNNYTGGWHEAAPVYEDDFSKEGSLIVRKYAGEMYSGGQDI